MEEFALLTDEPRKSQWAIFPIHTVDADGNCSCGRADCPSPGKHPASPKGLNDASRDEAVQKRLWSRCPQANVGLPTGSTNGIVVIDIDPSKDGKGGWESMRELEEQYGPPPETVEVETGGEGLHLYYRLPEGVNIGSRNGWRPGIDIKSEGGYVVAPPSLHASGRKYKWADGRGPGEIEMAELPEWLIDLLPKKERKVEAPQAEPYQFNGNGNGNGNRADALTSRAIRYVNKADACLEGTRNDTAFRLAGNLAAMVDEGRRLNEQQIAGLLQIWNARNSPPLPDRELRQCVSSSLNNGSPRAAKESTGRIANGNSRNSNNVPGTRLQEVSFQRITSAELATSEYKLDFIIEGTLVAGQPLIVAGPQKTLKTSLVIDAGVSIATGGFFLGKLKVLRRRRVAIMTGESGLATIQETAQRICRAAGTELKDCSNLIWSPDLPRFGNLDHLDALERFLAADDIEVLVIDPAYLAMPSSDAGNLMAQGELLRGVADLCQKSSVTLLIAHHTRKNINRDPYEPLELQDMAWAGFAEFARQWWLLNRREKYEPGTGEHRLWLSVGGSAGHSALWAADIREGLLSDPGGRQWDVRVSDAAGAREAEAERKQEARQQKAAEQLELDRKLIVQALTGLPDRTATKTEIRSATGVEKGRLADAIASLVQDKMLTMTQVTKANNRTYEAFALAT